MAFTAVAFQKLPGKPKHMVVAMGDSYSSGEGAGNYSPESDRDHGKRTWNACRRSANSWGRKLLLPGYTTPLGNLSDSHTTSVDFQNVTCSGATTSQLTTGDPNSWGWMGNYHEKTQMPIVVWDLREKINADTLTQSHRLLDTPPTAGAGAVGGRRPGRRRRPGLSSG
ncbi:hypothetical protein ABZ478_39115 [Streptomyces sp. NPDC005706]|uniref:hypothetical protein n=1 Tax=Streptomyces sp. NPDC005706 TaxID=3157169 RepID=UPI0033C08D37